MTDPPIPARLRVLVDAERARPDAPDDAKEAARAKLAALLGPGAGLGGGEPSDGGRGAGGAAAPAEAGSSAAPPSGAVAQASSGLAMKLAGALVIGGLVGGGVVATVAKPAERVVYVSVPAAPGSPAPSMTSPPAGASASQPGAMVPDVPVTALPDVAPARSSAQAAPPGAKAPVVPSADARGRDSDLSAERALVERARSALARGDAAGALAVVERHEREFARGQLVEEREVLAIQALAAAGRTQEAAERGARFRKAHPASLLLPLVDAALR